MTRQKLPDRKSLMDLLMVKRPRRFNVSLRRKRSDWRDRIEKVHSVILMIFFSPRPNPGTVH